MSSYPAWWDTTITVFNKYTNPTTHQVTWYKHTIDTCFWKNTGGIAKIGTVEFNTAAIICRIPQQPHFKIPPEWFVTPESERDNYFTLQGGDIIVVGECDFNIDEYQSGKRSTDLLKAYKQFNQCLEVKTYAIDTMGGMIHKHYYVQGV